MSVDTTTESAPAPKKGRNILLGLTLFGLLAALWLALGADRDAAAVPQRLLDEASRHLRMRVDDDASLATLAAIDVLRAEPGCGDCRAGLRQRLWRLLPTPPAKPTPRVQPTPTGNAYLDALQREAGQ